MNPIRTALVLAILSVYVPVVGVCACLVAIARGSPAILYRLARPAVRFGLWLLGIRVVVEGLDKVGDARNLVVMANHASHLDGVVLFQGLGIDFKVLAKKELFRIPALGWAMRLSGWIDIDRDATLRARTALSRVVASLRQGACFVTFPEGTRTRTGQLGPFKRGAFLAAGEAGSSILPVAIQGTREALARGRFRVNPSTVRVRVLDPVDAGLYSYGDRNRLVAEVRDRIATAS